MRLEFSRQIFRKNTQVSNSLRIRALATELFHAYGQTDMMKLIVAFRSFANSPKNGRESNNNNSLMWIELRCSGYETLMEFWEQRMNCVIRRYIMTRETD